MVWLVETMVVKHLVETEQGLLDVPVRVRFECELAGATYDPDSLSRSVLFNREAAARHTGSTVEALDVEVDAFVDRALREHLLLAGYSPRAAEPAETEAESLADDAAAEPTAEVRVLLPNGKPWIATPLPPDDRPG